MGGEGMGEMGLGPPCEILNTPLDGVTWEWGTGSSGGSMGAVIAPPDRFGENFITNQKLSQTISS